MEGKHMKNLFLLKQLLDIEEHLGSANEKIGNRKVLLTILRVTAFLVRQGMPLRSDGDEKDSNIYQILPWKLRKTITLVNG